MSVYQLRWVAYALSVAISAAIFLEIQSNACDLARGGCFMFFTKTLPIVSVSIGCLFGYLWKFLSERSSNYVKQHSPITLLRVVCFCFFGVALGSILTSLRGLTSAS